METGIELIAKERQEQIEKHGRTVELDVAFNHLNQLNAAITNLIIPNKLRYQNAEDCCPTNWDIKIWKKMYNKPYKERLVIAGALVAAEHDRFNLANVPSESELNKAWEALHEQKNQLRNECN